MKEHGLTGKWGNRTWVLDLAVNEQSPWKCQASGDTEEVNHRSQILRLKRSQRKRLEDDTQGEGEPGALHETLMGENASRGRHQML